MITAIDSTTPAALSQPQSSTTKPSGERDVTPSPDDARGALSEAQAAAAVSASVPAVIGDGRTIEFSYDRDIRRVIVRVKSSDGEVVRQIPADDYLKLAARFKELFGVLFDEEA
jgi:uncharacterized FlaG/YvyC family protein